MRIDLANWFEITATTIAIFCCARRTYGSNIALVAILLITIGVEFTAKYLNGQFKITNDSDYLLIKYALYSLFNTVKFCGFIWFVYFLLQDAKNLKIYIVLSGFVFVFVVVNFFLGQGTKVYNNYSNVLGALALISLVLYKLRQFDGDLLQRRERIAVLIYLFTLFFYYSINLPFYVFFEQMLAQNRTKTISDYRLINDTANYFFYAGLSIAAILFTFNSSENDSLNYTTA